MNLKRLIKDYLEEAKILQVATSVKNQPWACTVYFAFDDDLNLYWLSKPTRRHSQELRDNEKVSGTVVLPHTPGDKVRGVQLQGIAKELNSRAEAGLAMKHYARRFGMNTKRVKAILDNTDGHVCYKITPTLYVLFDEVNFPKEPRREYFVPK